tara:strand:- start:74 stop:400 length:327 start_codon:yes stop_codon:yes gene_type:complete
MAVIRDGDWHLYDHDPKLGRTVWSLHNPDGSITFRTDYAVQPTIDINTAQRNMAQEGWKGDYHHVASIPLNVFHDQLSAASMQNDQKYLSKWLNDSSNQAWRTKTGNV